MRQDTSKVSFLQQEPSSRGDSCLKSPVWALVVFHTGIDVGTNNGNDKAPVKVNQQSQASDATSMTSLSE